MSSTQFSPSIDVPDVIFSGKDHSFAVHGQIMLAVIVLLFTIFLLSMILLLCMKHLHPNCTAKSIRIESIGGGGRSIDIT
ncbi:hypothetical protein MTR67_045213 [Solanum verrucosum]|uniref:Uncharacterized protein n=1 Tax=Solanum verrucosum TaxID=315347 RepID=A0AAF0ZVY9_SOLVR|nr:hypothetical protein MTR67_045213 [Solanum verrucosum]